MKRKKTISGTDHNALVTITINIDSFPTMGRNESLRMMDALAGKAMALFQDKEVPFLFVPLVRLKVQ